MIQKEQYLKLGLIGLSNSTKFGSWVLGHIGAEILTNTFLLSEIELSKNVEKAIIHRIETILKSKPQFFESKDLTSPETSSVNEIENHLEKNLSALSTAGHGVIYGTLALKAIKQLHGWLPDKVRDGIIQLQQDTINNDFPNRYFGYTDYQNQEIDLSGIPNFSSPSEAAKFCLLNQVFFENQEINGTHYFFHGNQLHDITHSQALLMLEQLGYKEFAKIGIEQLRKQIKLGQTQPPNSKPFSTKKTFDPFRPDFWERKISDEHHNKLAYSIAFLITHLENINKEEVLKKVSGHWELLD